MRSRDPIDSYGIVSLGLRNSTASMSFAQVYASWKEKPRENRLSTRVCSAWYHEYPVGSSTEMFPN